MTNFFTFDLGRPLHVFDVAKLTGDVLTLRRGAGETLRALNGKDYVVDPEDCAICDAAGVQSMAGVIGGEATGCDETTTAVFVECALFDPVRDRADRPAAPDRLRRAPALRARPRSRADAGRDRGGDRDDPGAVRRRTRHRHRGRRANRPGSATPRCGSPASRRSAARTFRRTRRSSRWNVSASRCGARCRTV